MQLPEHASCGCRVYASGTTAVVHHGAGCALINRGAPDWSLDDWQRYREAKQRQVTVLQAELEGLRECIRRRDRLLVELVNAVDAFVAWWGSDGWSVTLLALQGAARKARSEIET